MNDLESADFLSRAELNCLQLERLKATVRRVSEFVPHYRDHLRQTGIDAGAIRSLDDLQKLPFTVKDDFRKNYPFGLLAVPMEEVVRIHASSGTTGKSTIVAYTRADLDNWADVMARTFLAGGVTRRDVVHNSYGYGLFTGGLGMHQGAERLGATVVPFSTGYTERQLHMMKDLGATVLCATPSYALHLADALESAGLTQSDLRLRVAFLGGEPWSEGMREAIEERLKITAINCYGLSEIIGPGVGVECPQRSGLHVFEDHFIPEIIDPHTLEPVPDGTVGELVLTTLTKEALPVLRYRTRDLTQLDRTPCPCGRSFARVARFRGRSDDMMIIRGVNVFPSQIEHALTRIADVDPHYLLVIRRKMSLDTLEIQVEAKPHVAQTGHDGMTALAGRVQHTIRQLIGITADVSIVPPKTIERSTGKAKRILDLRGESA
jgi:phenylacetate-CoA ligase